MDRADVLSVELEESVESGRCPELCHGSYLLGCSRVLFNSTAQARHVEGGDKRYDRSFLDVDHDGVPPDPESGADDSSGFTS
ncbi:MAG: hypothetical protein QF652_06085 [Dehalococcoidia bacterium]|nr:hypothetical protein [Dehalococcoidia bacterium]